MAVPWQRSVMDSLKSLWLIRAWCHRLYGWWLSWYLEGGSNSLFTWQRILLTLSRLPQPSPVLEEGSLAHSSYGCWDVLVRMCWWGRCLLCMPTGGQCRTFVVSISPWWLGRPSQRLPGLLLDLCGQSILRRPLRQSVLLLWLPGRQNRYKRNS